MGLLDAVRGAVSGAVNTVRETVSTTVEKVENKAVEVAQEARSVFDPKPSAPPPPPAAAISSNPTVSARSVAINPSLLRNDLSIASGKPLEGAEGAAKALIKKHTSFPAQLNEEALGNELKDMVEKDPANAAPVLKQVMQQLHSSDVDDVSLFVAKASDDKLRKVAETPDGRAALTLMSKELTSGIDDSDERAAAFKLNGALGKALENDPRIASERKEMRGASVYAANGHKEFKLDDPAAVKDLIVDSPQLDNIEGTKTDATRCSGAAMLNGMLLAGDPEKNARAIDEVSKKLNVPINADERSALDAMKKGVMTPTDAAHLQELLVRGASTPRPEDARRTEFRRAGSDGVSTQGLADFTQLLRAEGAFAKARDVTFHAEKGHWTVSVTNKAGEKTSANSFPSESTGKASLTALDGSTSFTEFSIENRDDGKAKFGVRGGMNFPGGAGQLRTPPRDSGFIDPKDGAFDYPNLLKEWSAQVKDPALFKRLAKEQGLKFDEQDLAVLAGG